MNWQTKSEEYFKASNKLILETLYNPSIHCSYYSCVHLMFYIISQLNNKSIESIEYESKSNINKVGTHNWLKKEIFILLKRKNNRLARDIQSRVSALSTMRAKADYLNSFSCNENIANECRTEAFEIKKQLNHNLLNIQ